MLILTVNSILELKSFYRCNSGTYACTRVCLYKGQNSQLAGCLTWLESSSGRQDNALVALQSEPACTCESATHFKLPVLRLLRATKIPTSLLCNTVTLARAVLHAVQRCCHTFSFCPCRPQVGCKTYICLTQACSAWMLLSLYA